MNQLSPSPDLTPKGPEVSPPRGFTVVPRLAIVLMLYKRKEPPGWMARAAAPRDSRPITEQVSALTGLAMSHLGENAVIGFDEGKEREG